MHGAIAAENSAAQTLKIY